MAKEQFALGHKFVFPRAKPVFRAFTLVALACLTVLPACQTSRPEITPAPQQSRPVDRLAELERLAEAGDADAAFTLGLVYDLGHGAEQNFAEAMVWYKRAAALGHVTAMFDVGVLYDAGRGVAADPEEAARWYRRAADQGFARADYDLGLMYLHGDGVRKDATLARQYFEAAERHGAEAARLKLALLNAIEDPTGERAFAQVEAEILAHGLSGLSAEAIKKLQYAARKGSPLAQYDLGYCYEHGIGLAMARVDAYVWYSRSAKASAVGENAAASATRAAATEAADAVQAAMTPVERQAAAAMLRR